MKTTEQYNEIIKEAKRYCYSRLGYRRVNERVIAMAKAAGKLPCMVFERVSIPSIGQAIVEYHFVKRCSMKDHGYINVHLYDEHENLVLLTSNIFVGMTDGTIRKDIGAFCVIIFRHAIDRYIERHRWSGTTHQLEDHMLMTMRRISYQQDLITHELICPFDGGVFLGKMVSNDMIELRTFVMNRQLHPNQRMDGISAEKFANECRREEL